MDTSPRSRYPARFAFVAHALDALRSQGLDVHDFNNVLSGRLTAHIATDLNLFKTRYPRHSGLCARSTLPDGRRVETRQFAFTFDVRGVDYTIAVRYEQTVSDADRLRPSANDTGNVITFPPRPCAAAPSTPPSPEAA